MRLRLKITLAISLLMFVMLVGSIVVQTKAVFPSFIKLERSEALKDWERCRDAISRETGHFLAANNDWAFWDDARNFVANQNPAFIAENLANRDWFVEQKIDVLFFVRPDGTVFWSHAASHESAESEQVQLAWLPRDRLPLDHPLMQVTDDRSSNKSGLILTELGPMIVVSSPILNSQFEGPMAGVMIFGKVLSPAILKSINAQTQVDFTAMPLKDEQIAATDRGVLTSAIQKREPQIVETSDDRLTVLGVLTDIQGAPMLMIKTDFERTISTRGSNAMLIANVSVAVAALVTLLALVILLRTMVIRPLQDLSSHVAQIGSSGALHTRLDSKRSDEFGQLANGFDQMMGQLHESRSQSLSMSRQAGMAEIATGVLHNVGNVLNSVNVSSGLIAQKLRDSRLGSFAKLVELIDSQKSNMGEFVSNDPRGKCLPDFLSQLHSRFRDDHDQIVKELEQLTLGVQHIKEVVRMQQSCAGTSSTVLAEVDPKSIIEDAIKVNLVSMERHKVDIERIFEPDLPLMNLDKHKILQILINLVSNAKRATCDPSIVDRQIVVSLRRLNDGNTLEFRVKDNGVGIEPQNVSKIFRHGFTTRADGHGFGLHSSANSATEMKGTLRGESDGPGKGATFILTVPIEVRQMELAA